MRKLHEVTQNNEKPMSAKTHESNGKNA